MSRIPAGVWPHLAPLLVCLSLACPGAGAPPPRAPTPAPRVAREVSLEDLLAHAARHAPSLTLLERRRAYGSAQRILAAPPFPRNPTVELRAGPRFEGSARALDYSASLAQAVDLAGARGARLGVATRMAARHDAELAAARWQVRRDVTVAFHAAVIGRERARLARRAVEFAREVLDVARRRAEAGDAALVDVRVAEADLAQARRAELAAEQAGHAARLVLADVAGWEPAAPPVVPDRLPGPAPVPALVRVLDAARERHPELRARHAAVSEASARVALAERETRAVPVVGVELGREGSPRGAASHLVLGTLEVELPIWQTNRGQQARRRADLEVARAEEALAARSLRLRILQAHAAVVAAAAQVTLLRAAVAAPLEENLALLRRGFAAGELPLLDVTAARERFLAFERDAVDAHDEYYRALAELEYVVGAPLARAVGGAVARGAR
ncbi:MAG: TolC family protein [Polyangiaceae bacterium]|nr:TolC family protein [Polyangiaceae bacterium]